MSEQIPYSLSNDLLPYQVPALSIIQKHLELLERKSIERGAQENRLSALETEANKLRSELGYEAIEAVSTETAPVESFCDQGEVDARSESLEILERLPLQDSIPVVIKRIDDTGYDQAPGVLIYDNIVLQRSGDLIFLEWSNSNTGGSRYSQPSTAQYVASKDMSLPLRVRKTPSEIAGNAFMLESAEPCSWLDFRRELKRAEREFETDCLLADTMAFVEGTSLVSGRFRGEYYRVRPLEHADRAVQVGARYYESRKENEPRLDSVYIAEYADGEQKNISQLQVEVGRFGRDKDMDDQEERKNFKRGLGVAKFILEQNIRNTI